MSNTARINETDAKPSHEQITVRAELLWKAKGSPQGQDEEIWLEAERQLYDEARELISGSSSSQMSSEEPNPSVGAQSSAAEEMRTPTPAPSRGGRRKSSGR